MKNLLLAFFVMTAMAISNDIQAQATCTPAQKEACQKICGTNPICTPEQIEACKKICTGSASTTTATAVKVVNKAPEDVTSGQATCSKINASPVKLVGLELFPKEKSKACFKPCEKIQE